MVFLGGQPVWMAVYYGQVEDANVESVYSFLQWALREAPAEFPVRGPGNLTEGRFSYRNVYEGGVANFWGKKTRGFMQAGYVDPESLLFARERIKQIREVARTGVEALTTLDAQYAAVFRRHPFISRVTWCRR